MDDTQRADLQRIADMLECCGWTEEGTTPDGYTVFSQLDRTCTIGIDPWTGAVSMEYCRTGGAK